MKGSSKARTHAAYIAEIEDEGRRRDVGRLHELIVEIAPDLEPTMEFGMMGYGKYHYKYKSGREGDWMKIGIANNKSYISLYCVGIVDGAYVAEGFKKRLPKADIGKSCVRFKRLSDLDADALEDLIRATAAADLLT
ncbi:MAG: DUF1801 domain-containing protein [Thermoanaerobaculia bacterium]